MSYLVLARKWRPRRFADVVGQEHVVRALANALEADRVHHAYLFAGTRGVGKTTIARILAKALNCETGVVAEPCGECAACQALDEGRFVDLIEVDAASRTGVDDTRELLENVQYTPANGRFKLYLIDEVHMLSRSSFNALLKTLEEPPPHVKFLLATTEPDKLPVTVLSRCLQFNLKRLPGRQIHDHLAAICAAESIDAEPAALQRLARSAKGSMRDGLSLLDQAIAFSGGALTDASVAEMLGSMGQERVTGLLSSVVAGDPAELMARIRLLDELVPDYERTMDELATALQRIAVIQFAGTDALDDFDDLGELERLAGAAGPDFVQLLYQIAVTGRRDLPMAPDPRLGFEMTMLRMFAFRPVGDETGTGAGGPGGGNEGRQPKAAARHTGKAQPARTSVATPAALAAQPRAPAGAGPVCADEIGDWLEFVRSLALDGAAGQLAENTALESASPFELRLRVQRRNEHLLTEQQKARLVKAVQSRVGEGVRVLFTVREEVVDTVAARSADQAERELRDTEQAIREDPRVRDLVDLFGAEVVPGSVTPLREDSNQE